MLRYAIALILPPFPEIVMGLRVFYYKYYHHTQNSHPVKQI